MHLPRFEETIGGVKAPPKPIRQHRRPRLTRLKPKRHLQRVPVCLGRLLYMTVSEEPTSECAMNTACTDVVRPKRSVRDGVGCTERLQCFGPPSLLIKARSLLIVTAKLRLCVCPRRKTDWPLRFTRSFAWRIGRHSSQVSISKARVVDVDKLKGFGAPRAFEL